jgi:hypothetical protein
MVWVCRSASGAGCLPSEAVKRKVTAVISLGWAQQGEAPYLGFQNMIVLEGADYARFKTDLREHRARFALNDVEYAEQVLKISLNTFKKCVNSADRVALTRPTFLHLFANTGLRPKDYGLPLTLPAEDSPYGGMTSLTSTSSAAAISSIAVHSLPNRVPKVTSALPRSSPKADVPLTANCRPCRTWDLKRSRRGYGRACLGFRPGTRPTLSLRQVQTTWAVIERRVQHPACTHS